MAERVGRDSPLKEYFVPLEEAVAATKSVRTKLLLHDMLNDLIVATQKLDTTGQSVFACSFLRSLSSSRRERSHMEMRGVRMKLSKCLCNP